MSLLDDSMIMHIENSKEFTKNKLLGPINEFFKVSIQHQLHLYMLAVNNWKMK